MNYKIFLAIFLLNSLHSFGQNKLVKNDTIPINSSTQKVSLVKVVDIENSTKEQIFIRLSTWYTQTSGATLPTGNEPIYQAKDSANKYYIATILNVDNRLAYNDTSLKQKEKVLYHITLYNNYTNTRLLKKNHAIGGYPNATAIFLIKDNKIKIEFTDFKHRFGQGTTSFAIDYSGFEVPFEKEKSPLLKDKEWIEHKLNILKRFQGLMDDIIKELKKSTNSEMDF